MPPPRNPKVVLSTGQIVPYRGDFAENKKRVAANGTVKKAKHIQIIGRDGRPHFRTIYITPPALPTIDAESCRRLFDPVTQKLLPGFNALQERMKELKADRLKYRYYDPCTKRLIGSFRDLEDRVFEIDEFINNRYFRFKEDVTLLDVLPILWNYNFDLLDPDLENRYHSGGLFNAFCKFFVVLGGIKGVNVNPAGGNYEIKDTLRLYINWNTARNIHINLKEIVENIYIEKSETAYDRMALRRIHAHEEEDGGLSVPPVCEVECSNTPVTKITSSKKAKASAEQEPNTIVFHIRIGTNEYEQFSLDHVTEEFVENPTKIIAFVYDKEILPKEHKYLYEKYSKSVGMMIDWVHDMKPFFKSVRDAVLEKMRQEDDLLRVLEELYFPGKAMTLGLQLHQDIIVQGVRKRLQEKDDNRFLIGVLPRGGKTFIAGGLIRDFMKVNRVKHMNVVWITAAPNETRLQLKSDLIHKFIDFREFEFVEVRDVSDISKKTRAHTIFFVSSQLLTIMGTGKARERAYLKELLEIKGQNAISMVFFDEAHKTGVGASTQQQVNEILEKYKDRNLPFIFLTATYYHILQQYNIPPTNTFIWDYTDVLSTRFLGDSSKHDNAVKALETRFGKALVDSVMAGRIKAGDTYAKMAKSYADYPDLHFLSLDFSPDALALFEAQENYVSNEEYEGFNMGKIFAIQEGATIGDFKTNSNKIRQDAYKMFQTPESVEAIITYLIPSTEKPENANTLNVPKPSHALLQRIHNISQANQSRFNLAENPSLMMFMPSGGAGTNIFFTLTAWASYLMNHSWWKSRYEVACVVDEQNVPKGMQRREGLVDAGGVHIISRNVKEHLLRLERELKCKEKKGLVVLAGEKMSMGVSLPCVDVVMLFNDKSSPDDLIQKMYRAVTPSVGKKTAFIVDLNPRRTLTAVYGYTRISSQRSLSPIDILNILYKTYSWDADLVPRGKEHLLQGELASTFQGMVRKLAYELQTNESKRKDLQAELRKLNSGFTGRTIARPKEISLHVDNSNLTHPDNLALLKPYKNELKTYMDEREKKIENAYKGDITGFFTGQPDMSIFKDLNEKDKLWKEKAKQYQKLVIETRKKRKILNAAEAKERTRAEATATRKQARATEAEEKAKAKAAAKAAEAEAKAKAKEEATAKKAAEAEEKLKAKAAAAAEKARLAEEIARLKAASKALTGTRKRSTAKAKAVAAKEPATPHTNNTELESNRD